MSLTISNGMGEATDLLELEVELEDTLSEDRISISLTRARRLSVPLSDPAQSGNNLIHVMSC